MDFINNQLTNKQKFVIKGAKKLNDYEVSLYFTAPLRNGETIFNVLTS